MAVECGYVARNIRHKSPAVVCIEAALALTYNSARAINYNSKTIMSALFELRAVMLFELRVWAGVLDALHSREQEERHLERIRLIAGCILAKRVT